MSCRCDGLSSALITTDHEDELLVVDVPVMLVRRCTLCGKKHRVEHIPGDYSVGDQNAASAQGPRISEGFTGQPLLPRTPRIPPATETISFGRHPDSKEEK